MAGGRPISCQSLTGKVISMQWRAALLPAIALLAAQPGVWAQSQSDIVWPTYDYVARVSDPGLTCAALAAEINHVAADIHLLNRAQTQVENVLRSAFDLERYGGSNGPGGMRVSIGGVAGKEAYAKARGEIVASLRVAQGRRDHLKGLEPGCKPGPQPVAAP
jgi:hypothetical protein